MLPKQQLVVLAFLMCSFCAAAQETDPHVRSTNQSFEGKGNLTLPTSHLPHNASDERKPRDLPDGARPLGRSQSDDAQPHRPSGPHNSSFAEPRGNVSFPEPRGNVSFPEPRGNGSFPERRSNSSFAEPRGNATFSDSGNRTSATGDATGGLSSNADGRGRRGDRGEVRRAARAGAVLSVGPTDDIPDAADAVEQLMPREDRGDAPPPLPLPAVFALGVVVALGGVACASRLRRWWWAGRLGTFGSVKALDASPA